MYELIDQLTTQCLNVEDEDNIDEDALAMEAVLILQDRLEGESIKYTKQPSETRFQWLFQR
jgi:hypothetical protein